MSPFSLVISLLELSAALGFGVQQPAPHQPTLIDLAREHGGIESTGMGYGWLHGPPTLESVLKDADVVVHGTVISAVSRLSSDEHDIWTDYTVQPLNVVYGGTAGSTVARSSEPPVFSAHGGVVFVEGLRIAQTISSNGSEVKLNVGDEVLLVGKASRRSYELGPTGVFTVQAGRVSPNGRWPKLTPNGASVDVGAFVARVRQITSHAAR
jgi:hypothetical protein